MGFWPIISRVLSQLFSKKQWSGNNAGVPKIQQELNSYLMLKFFLSREICIATDHENNLL